MNDRTDRIAREAARLLETGRAASIKDAIAAARASLRLPGARSPSHALVRQHAQGMAMQALGSDGYARSVQATWAIAERIMSTLEDQLNDASTLLLGRGAKGQFDADAELHLRVYTRADISTIAQVLVDDGCEEPQFQTVESRVGRLNRIMFLEEGIEVSLTRLPTSMREGKLNEQVDLFTGKPISALDLAMLRQRLSAGA